jgi:hypothetical protein
MVIIETRQGLRDRWPVLNKLLEDSRKQIRGILICLPSLAAIQIGNAHVRSFHIVMEIIHRNRCQHCFSSARNAMTEQRLALTLKPFIKLRGVKEPQTCVCLSMGNEIGLLSWKVSRG